jgi:Predicted membrane-associated Zn-dependent proteases 1
LQITTQMLIFIFLAYWILIYWLKRKGVLAKYNMSAFGPILTIETSKGLYLLDKIALPKRFWRLFANIGIILMFAGMIFMFSLVVFSDITLIRLILEGTVMEPNDLTKIQNIFLIPGVNQFIPFVWGLAALIIAVFIHEMMHSVLARVEGVRVHSVGIIAALFPIGGFAKIDDRQLYGDELDFLDQEAEEPADFNDLTASIEEIRAHEKQEAEAHQISPNEVTQNVSSASITPPSTFRSRKRIKSRNKNAKSQNIGCRRDVQFLRCFDCGNALFRSGYRRDGADRNSSNYKFR